MQPEDVDGMRRSLVIGGSLTRADVDQLLDTFAALLAQRAAIERIVAELAPSWAGAPKATNELHRVLRG